MLKKLALVLILVLLNANSSGVGDTLECWGYTGTKVTFYGTHDAIHTTGYHVYTSTQY